MYGLTLPETLPVIADTVLAARALADLHWAHDMAESGDETIAVHAFAQALGTVLYEISPAWALPWIGMLSRHAEDLRDMAIAAMMQYEDLCDPSCAHRDCNGAFYTAQARAYAQRLLAHARILHLLGGESSVIAEMLEESIDHYLVA